MKLATLDARGRDGALVIVNRALTRVADATDIAPTLQAALDDWASCEPRLQARAAALEADAVSSTPYEAAKLKAPLPRAYEWVDGSAYINHIVLVRKARKAEPPATLRTDPLIYQGGGGELLAPTADIVIRDEAWGCDFESEVGVILGDTPMGTTVAQAAAHVKLLVLVNDVSLRNLIPDELAKGFGFFQSKPATGFSPVACTPDELGPAWKDGRVHLTLKTWLNGVQVGDTAAGPEMHFSFFDLIAHVTKTRNFPAGSILGSGTVSNADRARGYSCLAEKRMLETIDSGAPSTPFLKHGDRVAMEMCLADGRSLFGRIEQRVTLST
jgi:fumarylacetoacetate (FAA) hydrolase